MLVIISTLLHDLVVKDENMSEKEIKYHVVRGNLSDPQFSLQVPKCCDQYQFNCYFSALLIIEIAQTGVSANSGKFKVDQRPH